MELIPDQTKYAVLGLETNHLDAGLPEILELPGGFFALRHLPLALPGHWREWLGTLAIDRIEDGGLYLFARAPTSHPRTSNHENEALTKSVHGLYWSLLLSTPFIAHERAIMLNGTRDGDERRVQGAQPYPRLPWTPYAPRPDVDEVRLRSAVDLTRRVAQLMEVASFERLNRANHTFYSGLQSLDCGDKTLAFVRTIEAFLLPPVGRAREAFIERNTTFVGGGQSEALSQMYDIRSAVVHLHNPTQLLPNVGERGRRLLLLKRCIQAEALARFCLSRLPERPQAYPFFQDDQTIENFWRLDAEQRSALWGPPLNLEDSLTEVSEARVDDEVLGL